MDPRLFAILELRTQSQKFVSGELSFEELLRALGWHAFDDEDDVGRWEPRAVVKDLCEKLQTEYLFYVKWRLAASDGKFKSTHWVYGESREPYGWIDKKAYYTMFSNEFRHLKLLEIDQCG